MTNYAKGIGLSPIIIFRNGAERSHEIEYCAAKNYPRNTKDDIYDLPIGWQTDDRGDARNYINLKGECRYSPPILVELPLAPNYAGFLVDCLTDEDLPACPVSLIYCHAIANPALTQSQRANLLTHAKDAIGPNFASKMAIIQKHLANNNFPMPNGKRRRNGVTVGNSAANRLLDNQDCGPAPEE